MRVKSKIYLRSMNMEKITVTLQKSKETKGTIVYVEIASFGKIPSIPTLYLPKSCVGTPVPERIEVSIEAVV
jgi:hypothetical protein